MKTFLKKAILAIAIIVLITGGLFIMNINIDATDIPPPCERKTECVPNNEGQKPGLICPYPRQPCALDATNSRDNNKPIQEDR
ncbi:MAG: hypothetical protein OXM61_12045 [Candidatus Poribacteria bacterium]|nr:hypothetical protein [Candidatus Poribacteria bacterium]